LEEKVKASGRRGSDHSGYAPTHSQQNMSNFLLALITFLLVNITWVFFRSPDFGSAMKMLLCMFGVITQGPKMLSTPDMLKVALVTIGLLGFHWSMRDKSVKSLFTRLPWWFSGTAWAVMLILIILTQKSTSSFIYFQF
jgi:alginate O-acetyltransferase complex protein AlgI